MLHVSAVRCSLAATNVHFAATDLLYRSMHSSARSRLSTMTGLLALEQARAPDRPIPCSTNIRAHMPSASVCIICTASVIGQCCAVNADADIVGMSPATCACGPPLSCREEHGCPRYHCAMELLCYVGEPVDQFRRPDTPVRRGFSSAILMLAGLYERHLDARCGLDGRHRDCSAAPYHRRHCRSLQLLSNAAMAFGAVELLSPIAELMLIGLTIGWPPRLSVPPPLCRLQDRRTDDLLFIVDKTSPPITPGCSTTPLKLSTPCTSRLAPSAVGARRYSRFVHTGCIPCTEPCSIQLQRTVYGCVSFQSTTIG